MPWQSDFDARRRGWYDRGMELKLKVLGGKSAGQVLPIAPPQFKIGRGAGCHLRPRSDAVAEQQCVIELEPASVRVRDLAANGITTVNGEAVQGVRELKSGDQLKVGPLEFEVQLTTGMASKKAPKVQSVEEAASRLATGRKKELDPSAWLDDPVEESADESPRSTKMSDEERAYLGLSAPPVDGAPAAENKPPVSKPADTTQAAADVLSKYFRKK